MRDFFFLFKHRECAARLVRGDYSMLSINEENNSSTSSTSTIDTNNRSNNQNQNLNTTTKTTINNINDKTAITKSKYFEKKVEIIELDDDNNSNQTKNIVDPDFDSDDDCLSIANNTNGNSVNDGGASGKRRSDVELRRAKRRAAALGVDTAALDNALREEPPSKSLNDDMNEGTDECETRRPRLPRIFYAARTHAQLTQVIQELKRCDYSPQMVTLGSRSRLCVNKKVLHDAKNSNVNVFFFS